VELYRESRDPDFNRDINYCIGKIYHSERVWHTRRFALFFAVGNVLVSSGLSSALIQKGNPTNDDYSKVSILNLSISLTLYLFLFFLSPYIGEYFDNDEISLISRVYFIIIFINAFTLVAIAKLKIDLDFYSLAKIEMTSSLIGTGVAMVLAINYFGVWALVSQSLTSSLVKAVLLYKISRNKIVLSFSMISFRELFGFGSKVLVTSLLATFTNNLQNVLIGKYFNLSQAGFYNQGVRSTNAISGAITSVINSVSFPLLSKIKYDKALYIKSYKKVLILTAYVTFPIMVVFSLVAREFVIIFLGEEWINSVPVIQYLCIATVLIPLGVINLNLLTSSGRSDLFLKTDIIKLPINLVALYIALPYGIEGVVVGQFITRILAFIINSYYPGKLLGYGLWPQVTDLLPIITISVGLALVLSLVNIDDHVLGMVTTMIIGFLAYLMMALTIKVSAMSEIVNLVKSKLVRQN